MSEHEQQGQGQGQSLSNFNEAEPTLPDDSAPVSSQQNQGQSLLGSDLTQPLLSDDESNDIPSQISNTSQVPVKGSPQKSAEVVFDKMGQAVKSVVPKLERLPWSTFLVLFLLAAVPATGFILLHTQMGYGLQIMRFVDNYLEQYSVVVFGVTLGLFFILYFLDAESWTSNFGVSTRILGISLVVCGICLMVFFLGSEFPYAPISLFTVLIPIWMVAMKFIFYDKVQPRAYIVWLSGPLFVTSLIASLVWFIWIFSTGNMFSPVMKLEDIETTGCEPDFSKHMDCIKHNTTDQVCFEINESGDDIVFPEGCAEHCVEVYDHCLHTFILWIGPLLMGICLLFLSFFCTFLRSDTLEGDVISFAKLWIFLIFALWGSVSLSGVGTGITFALAALTLASFAASFVFLSSVFTVDYQKTKGKLLLARLSDKYGSHMDYARGLIILGTGPVFVAYLALSFVNQLVRKARLPCSSKPIEDGNVGVGHSEWLTTKGNKHLKQFRSWDRSKVYTYALYWGIFIMVMFVIVTEFTTVFLSWLITKTKPLGILVVTFIMVGVGLLMFLLPPVPGIPVYIALGIVIPAASIDTFGLAGSIFYCLGVNLFLKLAACAMQQKLIGESMSRFVSVRQLVAINSDVIRSMNLILSENGITLPKVAILVGGPDWPTSVLCGIMKLGLFQILIGTLPVVVLIAPTMMTGTCLYLKSVRTEDNTIQYPWAATVGTVCVVMTGVVGFSSFLIAAYYLQNTTTTKAEELSKLPYDKEVQEADEKDAHRLRVYAEVTQWERVPLLVKWTLTLAVATMSAGCYMVLLFSTHCFVEYELTDTIQDNLDGNFLNFVKPLGWASIGLFVFASILLSIFKSWANRKAKKVLSQPEDTGRNLSHRISFT